MSDITNTDNTDKPAANSSQIQDILARAGRYKRKQRLGRGEGSKGKTSGRGQKGAGARGGKPKRLGFEGGQTEIYRRFPQRGFSNAKFKTVYQAVNVSMLERFEDGTTVDRATLKAAGLISNNRDPIKVLGHGSLSKKLDVRVDAYSRNAHKLIGEAGGTAKTVDGGDVSFAEPKNARLGRKLDKRLSALGLEPQAKADATPDAEPGDADGQANAEARADVGEEATTGDSAPVTEAPESGEPTK